MQRLAATLAALALASAPLAACGGADRAGPGASNVPAAVASATPVASASAGAAGGASSSGAAASPSPPASASAPAPAPAAPAPPPSKAAIAARKLLHDAYAKLATGDLAGAAAIAARAREAAGDDADTRFDVAYTQATIAVYRNDLDAAAQALLGYLADTKESPASPAAFRVHNTMMMVREAQGDVAAALVECDEMTLAGQRGTWDATGGEPREAHTLLKDRWHRAYLVRLLAEQETGSRRAAALGYAEKARREYAELARPLADHADSIAVLDALFAALDGDKARALEAARRVNVDQDDDVEDLYLVEIGLAVGGDAAGAARVDKKIRAASPYLAVPIMTRWLDADAHRDKPRFSPRHPASAR